MDYKKRYETLIKFLYQYLIRKRTTLELIEFLWEHEQELMNKIDALPKEKKGGLPIRKQY